MEEQLVLEEKNIELIKDVVKDIRQIDFVGDQSTIVLQSGKQYTINLNRDEIMQFLETCKKVELL